MGEMESQLQFGNRRESMASVKPTTKAQGLKLTSSWIQNHAGYAVDC